MKKINFDYDLKIIFLTIWFVFSADSKLPYKIYKDLPIRKN